MKASKSLQIVAVFSLVTAAFFVGRGSVQQKQAELKRATTPPQQERKKPLSALTSKDKQPPETTELGEQNANTLPPGSAQELATAQSVSDFLALAAADLDDFWSMTGIIAKWMERNPEEAIDWLASGERRNDILSVMFAIWSEDNLAAASAWLAAHPDLDGYEHAAVGLAVGLVGDGQNEAALALAEKIAAPLARSQIWTEAGYGLYDTEPEATVERLANSALPDELQRAMVEEWTTRLSQKGKRNAQNLASVYSSAVAAGAQFSGNSAAEIASEIVAGVNGADSFKNTTFQVPNMSETELARALDNLAFDQGSLSYYSRPEDDP